MTAIPPIVSAIFSRSAKEVARLAKAHPEMVNDASPGLAPLHEAAQMNAYKIGSVLLDHGADPNIRDYVGNTPLHYAALCGAVRFCQLLLKCGAGINAYNLRDVTPLSKALFSRDDHAPQCAILIRSFSPASDLVAAIYSGDDPLIASLVRATEIDDRRRRQIVRSVPDLMRAWMNEAQRLWWAPNSQMSDEESLNLVIEKRVATLDLLLEHGAQLDAEGNVVPEQALFVALGYSGAKDILLRLLLERGANPNQRRVDGYTPLLIANPVWNPEANAVLREYGAK